MNTPGERVQIIMDARKASGEPTGVGQYEKALLAELSLSGVVRPVFGSGFAWHVSQAMRMAFDRSAIYFSPESLIVPTFAGKRSMLTIHDLTPLTHPDRHTRRNLLFHKALLKIAVKRVGAIIVPTEAVRRDVEAYFPGAVAKTTVVHEGVRFDVPEEVAPISLREKCVVYLGTIEPRKNVDSLCRAMASANDSRDDDDKWRLILIGKRGWLSDEQKVALDAAVVASGALELGYQSNEAVDEWLSRAGIFAYPSEAEGFGLPPLEAMAAGVPVVVTDDAALSEVVGHAGTVVNRGPELERALAAALTELMDDPRLRTERQKLGRARASNFSWSAAAAATWDVARGLATRS